MLYSNLYSALGQLYLNKTGRKKKSFKNALSFHVLDLKQKHSPSQQRGPGGEEPRHEKSPAVSSAQNESLSPWSLVLASFLGVWKEASSMPLLKCFASPEMSSPASFCEMFLVIQGPVKTPCFCEACLYSLTKYHFSLLWAL